MYVQMMTTLAIFWSLNVSRMVSSTSMYSCRGLLLRLSITHAWHNLSEQVEGDQFVGMLATVLPVTANAFGPIMAGSRLG
ncbi:hypothetical protein F4819DRAFT_476104 [Hypoxylon fuscum]|nr:hypothetical protein F4819DRAFT_476104 [Hypoxylon fuscum]